MLHRRGFFACLTGLATTLGLAGKVVGQTDDKVRRIFNDLHRQLCDILILRSNGAIRTLHGADRERGCPVFYYPRCGRLGLQAVYVWIDFGKWSFAAEQTAVVDSLLTEKYITGQLPINPNDPLYRLYPDGCPATAYTNEFLTKSEWQDVLDLFTREYPNPGK